MNNIFNNQTLLQIILKWKIHLMVIAVLAGIVSIVFSGPTFIKPKYKSTAVLYPVNLGEYSEESETEQMIQILESGDIRDRLISTFDLSKHYKIDPSYKYYLAALYGEFGSNVSIKKTEYEAVRIDILDTDPQIACNMVDSMVEFYHDKVRDIHRMKWKEKLDISENQLQGQLEYLDSLKGQLKTLGNDYGIIDYTALSEEATEAYFNLQMQGKGQTSAAREAKTLIKNLGDKGGDYLSLVEDLENAHIYYEKIRTEHAEAVMEYTKKITYSIPVTKPFPADKKSSPVRSVIVLMSVILTLIVAIIVIGIIESRKRA